MTCPDPSCGEHVTENELKKVLDPVMMEKYERFSLLAFLKNEPNAHWCPLLVKQKN